MNFCNMDQLFLKYQLALDVLKNKFDSLYLECSTMGENNPIEHIKYRLKSVNSIEEKLQKKGLPISSETIEQYLNDVVGVRIVCSFLNDMSEIIQIIRNDPQIRLLNEKDYISTPKESGYSSYHMIVEVPVLMSSETVYVKAEIQVRTIAMDMWASLEHKIWYKKNIELPDPMMKEIDKTAEFCRLIDDNLNDLIKKSNSPRLIDDKNLSMIDRKEFNFFMLKYQAALETVKNKINVIYEEYECQGTMNPIEHIKSRLKTPTRMMHKLTTKGKSFNLENIEKYVQDIAGIRIVCSFRSDLEELVKNIKDMIAIAPNLELVKEKDYVTKPKPSGYAGYHLIVQVPIHFIGGTTYAKVEIQIRTIAMDMWASLEHKLCYQKEVDPSIRKEVKEMAGIIQIIDENMNSTIKESINLKNKSNRKKKILKQQI